MHRLKLDFSLNPYCPDCPNSPKAATPCFISCYVHDKHNINLAVFSLLKHESQREIKHIELKPTQKNWPIVSSNTFAISNSTCFFK